MLRAVFLVGVVSGALAGGGVDALRGAEPASPSVRIPVGHVLHGHAVDSVAVGIREAVRVRAGVLSETPLWPPAPLRPRGRAPIADEGVFHPLLGTRDAVLTWIRVDPDQDDALRVIAFRADKLRLGPYNGDPTGVLAWLRPPPTASAVDSVLRAINAPVRTPDDDAAPPSDGAGEVLALCRDGDGHALLLFGGTRDADAVARLMRGVACTEPGAVWTAQGPAARLGASPPGSLQGLWVLQTLDHLAPWLQDDTDGPLSLADTPRGT